MSNAFLPHEIVENVLSRLPVKSLMRFKCVSKPWCRIINCPKFIKTHLKQSKSKSNIKVIAESHTRLYEVDFYLKSEEINYPFNTYIRESDNDSINLTVIGSCNGVICLDYLNRKHIVILWNPSTRKHIQLPINPKQRSTDWVGDTINGFGYDAKNDDYKVFHLRRGEDVFSIFSLKTNKWTCLEDFTYAENLTKNFKPYFGGGNRGVFANGALHLLLDNNSVLAFDIETEEFKVLPPPQDSLTAESEPSSVEILSSCEHLIFKTKTQTWIMKNDGSKDSWSNITSDLETGKQSLRIMSVCDYNKNFRNYFPSQKRYGLSCPYVESLVSLGAGEENDVMEKIHVNEEKAKKSHVLERLELSRFSWYSGKRCKK